MYETGSKAVQHPRNDFTRDRGRSDVADSPELERAQKRAIHDSIEHLHGPDSVDLPPDELIVRSSPEVILLVYSLRSHDQLA
jgi:hypothetical protein